MINELETTVYNLTGYPLRLIVASLLLVIISWFISQNAKNIIPRLIFTISGLYLILAYPIMSYYTLIGIGFILSHIKTVIKYIYFQFLILKQATINSYYFSLTLLARFLNLFKWIFSFFKFISILFTTFNFRKAKHSYEKENPQEDIKQEYEQYYKQEEYKAYNNSNTKSSDEESKDRYNKWEQYYQEEEPHKEDEQQEDNTYNNQESNEQTYEENNSKEEAYEEPYKSTYTEPKNPTGKAEFEKYFSSSKYDILEVSPDTPYKEVNKQYKKLAKMFHHDLGTVHEETGLVMKNINLAFDCFKSKNKNSKTHHCKFC